MARFELEQAWWQHILPEGISLPSATLISGPGGSGKPLIAGMLLASWLKKGGAIIYFLINSGREYAEKIFSIYNLSPQNYKGKVFYIEFDPQIETWQEVADDHVKANLLRAETWDLMLKLAAKRLDSDRQPVMLFAAALNILYFSPSYREEIHRKLSELITSDWNSLFTISNNVFEDKMQALESQADNLMFTRSGGNGQLYLRIERMKDVPFDGKEVAVPLSEHELRGMRSEAEKMRKHLIPLLKNI